ncbi:MAG TPA: arsenic resistance N-acetyltransferase ArsN2 [Gemmatimonadales bacterium]|nr:arsenic resistance N-acetyltransferase ArsN2 [Gemmatimonadales bacterium]
MTISIEAARQEDLAAILALLDQHRLPHAGIERHLADAVVARDGASLAGCAAVERYGAAGLLRSVAVDGPRRGTGLGGRLTAAALAHARAQGVRTVYLLTDTAAGFFPRFGFRPIPREAVAPAVRASPEFTGACPDTAMAMVKDL